MSTEQAGPDPAAPNPIDAPGTPEADWRAWPGLGAWPALAHDGWRSAVVIAAHPDDEVLGVGGLLSLLAASGLRLRLVAVTDADTLVPPCWLSRRLRHASQGWEAVVGTVVVTDWDGYPPRCRRAYAEEYAAGAQPGGARADGAPRWHPHVHGANLGVTAAAYLAVGGFRALPSGEDHALVTALESAGRRVLRTTDVTVVTSARRDARAPDGFGRFLTRLEHDTVSGGD